MGGWSDEPPSSGTEAEAGASVELADEICRLAELASRSPQEFVIDVGLILELHRVGAQGIVETPGTIRTRKVEISNSAHVPPLPEAALSLLENMCTSIMAWTDDPIDLAAFTLWRLNWIHPFDDGNGRTARALTYVILCWKLRLELPGRVTLLERILQHKGTYYRCLSQLDVSNKHAKPGRWKLQQMSGFIARMLRDQLKT